MDDQQVSTSSGWIGAIIRIVILIVLIILIAFFVVRFIQNRRAGDRADQAVNTTTEQSNGSEADEQRVGSGGDSDNEQSGPNEDEREPSSEGGDSDDSSNGDEVEVPGGVADVEQTPRTGPQSIPEAGIGENIALTALTLSVITFLGLSNRQYRDILRK